MKYIRQFAEYSTATDAAIELFDEKHGCPFIFKVDNNLEYNSGEGDYLTCYHYADDSVITNRDQIQQTNNPPYSGIENYATLTKCNLGSYCTEIPIQGFAYCSTLTSVSMPNVTNIGTMGFFSCSSLKSISLPKVTSIGDWAFVNCSTLTSVSIPNAAFIGSSAFNSCSSLSSIYIPNVSSIGQFAFQYCYALTSVSMTNVTSIGNQAFAYCSALSTVYLPDIPPTLGESKVFQHTHPTLKLYVSSQATKDAYLAATNWKELSADTFVVIN